MSLARKVGAGRLPDACRWAENIGQYSYSTIEEILTKRLDQLHPEEEPQDLPSHDNIRGKDYYQ
ncbi:MULTISPECIES: hypothetical protein [Elizabethkingia]|uniref:hypothetical protein n=1 Tax=Elizabethkingia TaxID=308865 RepID=UPI001C88D49A|nr:MULTISPECIES: hypothetical protein [Elizabethkingia]